MLNKPNDKSTGMSTFIAVLSSSCKFLKERNLLFVVEFINNVIIILVTLVFNKTYLSTHFSSFFWCFQEFAATWAKIMQSAKLPYLPYMLILQRALHAYILMCQCALLAYVVMCQHALCAHVPMFLLAYLLIPTYLAWSRAKMPSVLLCSCASVPCIIVCWHANVCCLLTCLRTYVPTCLACLHAHLL